MNIAKTIDGIGFSIGSLFNALFVICALICIGIPTLLGAFIYYSFNPNAKLPELYDENDNLKSSSQ